MARVLLAFALAFGLIACSGSESPGRKPGEWVTCSLAGGNLTFSLPTSPQVTTRENGAGQERITEEIASCEFYEEGLGICFFSASVLSGPQLPTDLGTTSSERKGWTKLFLVGLISGEEGRQIEEEGEWALGDENGRWLRLRLPPSPPKRTIPVITWVRAAPWGDRAVTLQFIGSQAGYDNSMLRPKQEKLRDRFFASVAAH